MRELLRPAARQVENPAFPDQTGEALDPGEPARAGRAGGPSVADYEGLLDIDVTYYQDGDLRRSLQAWPSEGRAS